MPPPIADMSLKALNIEKTCDPPWRPISSRRLSQLLGVSLQVLANWRVRGTGPEAEPKGRGKGNKIFYRPDKVIEWLEDGRRTYWEIDAQWLERVGLKLRPDCREIENAVNHIERSGRLARYIHLARSEDVAAV